MSDPSARELSAPHARSPTAEQATSDGAQLRDGRAVAEPATSGFDLRRYAAERATSGALGAPLVAVARTGSTNDDAFVAAAEGAPHGATFVADEQTAGRGRQGRRWLAQPGESLLVSVLLRELPAPERVPFVPLVVGLALRAVLSTFVPGTVRVKWPNDVLIDDRKVAGVLVERRVRGAGPAPIVVGFGVNLTSRELPKEVAQRATSLVLAGGAPCSRERMLARALEALELRLQQLQRDAGLAVLVAELREHDALLGRDVTIDGKEGVARGIAASGALLVERAGALQEQHAGVVELR